MKPLPFKSINYFLLLFSIFFIQSCKKGDNGRNNISPNYYISFKVNGVQKNYTDQTIAAFVYSSQSTLYNGVLTGNQVMNISTKSHIGLFVFDNNAISARTYQDPGKAILAGGGKMSAVLLNYYDENGNAYLSMGPMVDENGNPLPGLGNAIADAKVTITKLTTSYVEGTFSGTLALSTDGTLNTTIQISEGKFALQRIE